MHSAHPPESTPATGGTIAHPPPLYLTRERRRAVCVHEAAHAVVHALGGAYVYRVAVAPEGATDWQTTGRKGGVLSDLWGVCSASDSPALGFMQWEADDLCIAVNRPGFAELLRLMEAHHRGAARELRRQLRAHVCASLAGPAAEQLHDDPAAEPYLAEGEFGTPDDIAFAEAHSWLLPQRGELDRLAALTVATLRRPDVWALVLAVADRLEAAGDLDDEAVQPLLPMPAHDWPPGPRASVRRLQAVQARGAAQ